MTALYLSREGVSYDMQHGLELTRAVPVLGDFHAMPEGGGGASRSRRPPRSLHLLIVTES